MVVCPLAGFSSLWWLGPAAGKGGEASDYGDKSKDLDELTSNN
jgi:hypothetical protein